MHKSSLLTETSEVDRLFYIGSENEFVRRVITFMMTANTALRLKTRVTLKARENKGKIH